MMVPSGWNKFDGEVGAYDLKWQDLVDKSENIKVSSSPVKSTTTAIDALGDVQDVGKNLAAKRNAKLISAKERLTDGVLFYKFDFAIGDGTHQLLQLCVCKGKLWSIDASSTVSLFDSIRYCHLTRFLLSFTITRLRRVQIFGGFSRAIVLCFSLLMFSHNPN